MKPIKVFQKDDMLFEIYVDEEAVHFDNYSSEEVVFFQNGEVYGFVLKTVNVCKCCKQQANEELDSCWGFYGYDEKFMAEQAGITDLETWEEVE